MNTNVPTPEPTMPKKKRKPYVLTRELTSVYFDPPVKAALMKLSVESGAPLAHHVRVAVRDYLKKHKVKVKGGAR